MVVGRKPQIMSKRSIRKSSKSIMFYQAKNLNCIQCFASCDQVVGWFPHQLSFVLLNSSGIWVTFWASSLIPDSNIRYKGPRLCLQSGQTGSPLTDSWCMHPWQNIALQQDAAWGTSSMVTWQHIGHLQYNTIQTLLILLIKAFQ
jgi:hypothetical protein